MWWIVIGATELYCQQKNLHLNCADLNHKRLKSIQDRRNILVCWYWQHKVHILLFQTHCRLSKNMSSYILWKFNTKQCEAEAEDTYMSLQLLLAQEKWQREHFLTNQCPIIFSASNPLRNTFAATIYFENFKTTPLAERLLERVWKCNPCKKRMRITK